MIPMCYNSHIKSQRRIIMSNQTAAVSKTFTTKEIVLTAMFTAIIDVSSWITIPNGPVSFTLQTFAVFCAALILGGRNSLFSVVVYLLRGAVGLPVFAGFSGGVSALVSNSGGYLVGFLFIPIMYWVGEKFFGESLPVRIVSLVLGLAICYAFGTAWFMYAYARNVEAVSLGQAMKWCVTPFVPFDLIKMALAIIISDRVKKYAHL